MAERFRFLQKNHLDYLTLLGCSDGIPEGVYLYLNPLNYDFITKLDHAGEVYYSVDGRFVTGVLSLYGLTLTKQSFDFTSLADPIFKDLERSRQGLFIAGGTGEDIQKFSSFLQDSYPRLNLRGVSDGYSSEGALFQAIQGSGAEVVLLGLGNIKQESVAISLSQRLNISIFTCGAFISQTASVKSKQYYPQIFVRADLRFLYRFFREPRTVYRVLRHYPLFILKICRDFLWSKFG